MITDTFGLLFLTHDKGDLPGPPICRVYVQNYSHAGYRGAPADLMLITPEAVSPREFEGYIDQLKAELERIKIQARRENAAKS